jgi:preprotein translocase subunit SecD
LAIASYTPGSGLSALSTRRDDVQAALEVIAVNDELDPLALADEASLPAGVAKFSEVIRDPNGQTRSLAYARLVLQGKESLEQALQRLRPWQDRLTLPADARLAWQPLPAEADGNVPPVDPAHEPEPTAEAFRSYLVQSAPIFSAFDVDSVELTTASDGLASTTLRLTRPAAERLRGATHDRTGRRLAIIVDERVVSAPVVQGEIANGMLQISPGGLDPTETRQRARALLSKLTRRPAN